MLFTWLGMTAIINIAFKPVVLGGIEFMKQKFFKRYKDICLFIPFI